MYTIDDYSTSSEMSAIWGVSDRMVVNYCLNGLIEGAIKKGSVWLIPNRCEKPKGSKIYPEVLKEHSTKYESHRIEWKENWRLDYLQTFSAFANTDGGLFYIGIDDRGEIIGVDDSKRLMEEIPNQAISLLGLAVSVECFSKIGKEYIEVTIPMSSFPISYRGKFYKRVGSTTQLLSGISLIQFLSSKMGIRWESVGVDGISIDDLDRESIEIFERNALNRGRLSADDINITNEELIKCLGLLSGSVLSRAGVLLFYREQEKFFPGVFTRIGYFENDGVELVFQDEVHCSLILQADRVVDLLFLKYLKAKVSYEKDVRVERYQYPREAIREAVFNALVHSDWSAGIPIQIKVDSNSIFISNNCILPENWSERTLMSFHKSEPRNPLIANVFYRAGYIESWGRGIKKICDSCIKYGIPIPKYYVYPTSISIEFSAEIEVKEDIYKDSLDDEIMEYLMENPKATYSLLEDNFNIARTTVNNRMKKLESAGYIKRLGSRKDGIWIVKEN